MLIVKVFGIPAEMQEPEIGGLYRRLVEATVEVKKLGLTDRQIAVFFPSDRMKMGLGKEIIIFVEGLFEKPERTEEVRNRLARALGETAREVFPNATVVECLINSFKPQAGFWTSAPIPF
jgi:hypothetical protein